MKIKSMYCEHLPTLLVKKITLYDSPTIWTVLPSCSCFRRTTRTLVLRCASSLSFGYRRYIFRSISWSSFDSNMMSVFYFWVCCQGFSGSLLSGIIVKVNYYSLLLTGFKGFYLGRRQMQWCYFFTSTINSTL